MTDRWTAETEDLVARFTWHADTEKDHMCPGCRGWARRVLTALADAGLLADGAAIDEGRHQAAAAILTHADKHAPKDGNEAQRRLRRHLEIAARVAAPPITLVRAAEALNAALIDGGGT